MESRIILCHIEIGLTLVTNPRKVGRHGEEGGAGRNLHTLTVRPQPSMASLFKTIGRIAR